MADIDPDLTPMFDEIEKRLTALQVASDLEAMASIEFKQRSFRGAEIRGRDVHIGLKLGLAARRRGGAALSPFLITFTGLTDGEARIGDHASIGYIIDPDNGTETVAWGTVNDDDTYGTGADPTDITAGDGGNLVLSVTDGGETRYISAPIRYAAAVNTVAPVASGTRVSVILSALRTGHGPALLAGITPTSGSATAWTSLVRLLRLTTSWPPTVKRTCAA
jgi:hypothetical protein